MLIQALSGFTRIAVAKAVQGFLLFCERKYDARRQDEIIRAIPYIPAASQPSHTYRRKVGSAVAMRLTNAASATQKYFVAAVHWTQMALSHARNVRRIGDCAEGLNRRADMSYRRREVVTAFLCRIHALRACRIRSALLTDSRHTRQKSS